MPCLVLGSSSAKLSTLMGVRGGDHSYFWTLRDWGRGPKSEVMMGSQQGHHMGVEEEQSEGLTELTVSPPPFH